MPAEFRAPAPDLLPYDACLSRPTSSTFDETLDRFAAIHERDVDLLVLEELHCNKRFSKWLYSALVEQCHSIRLPTLNEFALSARHSVDYPGGGAGETDLELRIRGQDSTRDARILCLLESKIDARFTPTQPQRYRARANEIRAREGYDYAITALLAPQDFLSQVNHDAFDAKISHEMLLSELAQPVFWSDSEQDLRRVHRVGILKHSLRRFRRGRGPDDEPLLGRFSAIQERDIDLLVLEELLCNRRVAKWFLAELTTQAPHLVPGSLEELLLNARHSVSYPGDGAGESDLELTISGSNGDLVRRILCLIENKIDSPFMPGQPQRYRTRAMEIRDREKHDHAITTLIAPQTYLARVERSLFDAMISHEMLVTVLSEPEAWTESEHRLRREHRVSVLKHAIERNRRGGNRINDDRRTTFFDDYANIVERESPLLRQKPERPRSKLCDMFFFDISPYLSKGNVAELYGEHKFREGWAAINFRGWGIERDRRFYVQNLSLIAEPDFEVAAPSDRQYVRVRIKGLPKIDPESSAVAQQVSIVECARAIGRLMEWCQRHRDRLDSWANSRRNGSPTPFQPRTP